MAFRLFTIILLLWSCAATPLPTQANSCNERYVSQPEMNTVENFYNHVLNPGVVNANEDCNNLLIEAIRCCMFPEECGMPSAPATDPVPEGALSSIMTLTYNNVQRSNYYRRIGSYCSKVAQNCRNVCHHVQAYPQASDDSYLGQRGVQICEELNSSTSQCYLTQGDSFESSAQETAQTARQLMTESKNHPPILCGEQNGTRDCQYLDYMSSEPKDLDLSKESLKNIGFSTVRIESENGSSCSGNLLADGKTISSAGHCEKDFFKGSNLKAQTYDSNGNLIGDLPLERIGSSYSSGGETLEYGHQTPKDDVALYKLATPAIKQENPSLLLAVDESIDGCLKSDIFLRCNVKTIQSWEAYEAARVHYPNGQQNPRLSKGKMRFNPNSRAISSNMRGTAPGSSGSGLMMSWTNNSGQRYNLVMAPQYGNTFMDANNIRNTTHATHSIVPEYETLQEFYVGQTSSERIIQAQAIMTELENET